MCSIENELLERNGIARNSRNILHEWIGDWKRFKSAPFHSLQR